MPKLTIQKSISINAPLEKVYDSVRDFKQWPLWSPWIITEPDCSLDYASDGKSYSWDGTIIGSGSMAITHEDKPKTIDYTLTFLKPWKSTSTVRFSFEQKGDTVETTWTMNGSLPFFLFWMKPMMTCVVGMDYERGLRMLKDYLEVGSVPSKLDFTESAAVSSKTFVGIKTSCHIDKIASQMEEDFAKLLAWKNESGIEASDKPFTIYHKWDMNKRTTEYTTAFPVKSIPSSLPDGFTSGNLPECQTYAVKHTGPYRHVGNAWSAGMMRGRSKVFKQSKALSPFEVYENMPQEVEENSLVATVHFPLK